MSDLAPGKRLFIKSYGCQMNVYDSERMADVLRPLGYALTERSEDADLVILNTCHIRERATEKVFSELGRAKAVKAERAEAGQATLIAVAGCVAQAQGAEIIRRQPAVDLVIGPQSYHRLPEMIARAHRSAGERLATDFEADAKFDALPERTTSGVTAFLTVQEGCDRFCTFCVVPYRGGGVPSALRRASCSVLRAATGVFRLLPPSPFACAPLPPCASAAPPLASSVLPLLSYAPSPLLPRES